MPTDLSRIDLILIIVCSVLAALLICACIVIIVFCLKRKKQQHKIDEFRYAPLDNEIKRYKKQREKYKNKLKNQDFLNYDVALNDMKVILDQELDEYKRDRLLSINQQINHDKNEILRDVILNSMQPLHLRIINESSVYYLPIDEKFKPLLIGKKGANIKKLNEITKCNINVERDSKYIEISSPNPYNKQLAINTINHLLKSEAFDLNAIENVYKKETKVMRMNCIEIGKKYLDNLNIKVDNSSIYEYVGRLRYRWSFNQNVLEHCYEVALICENLAKRLGLDPQTAKEVGFFHDIGKSLDYERRFDHIDTGIKIAKQCGLSNEIINGIHKHHRTNCNEDYVLLTRCADAWSAARIGARHTPTENENNTIKIVESKIKKIKGIISYKVEIKDNIISVVFVPVVPNKSNYLNIKYDIIHAIKKDVRLNKHKIVIHD